jgi:hypothetical protein
MSNVLVISITLIGGVMVSVLTLSAGLRPGWIKAKTIKLEFAASPLNTQQ